ncbi:dihydrolipoyl dehydrogenase [Thioflexithrix psekupsensis]|uniref:Dihydrolipoyl dehydrogenase n=1 Tax=Thioflexithrix psekupsensis TaxID=1570016 RepID=A0A251XD97_9GAMM|nr:dihydrolipoyl dehydrogenase [Thioflexithrix psekupsensis]OUD16311.1 dihydrolipoyl dehydrogenase [Thioflexithrix psekupsensis]
MTPIYVPDIGDFKDVPIIEILVKEGDRVSVDAPLVTLESDKATMDIPAPCAGVITRIRVNVGDKVTQGTHLFDISPAEATQTAPAPVSTPAPVAAVQTNTSADIQTEVVVIGAGPGGYTAAFRAADLGKKVLLIERFADLGGVCLNVGCIPSKALLHTAAILNEAREMETCGVHFAPPKIDLAALLTWKNGIIKRLTGGLAGLAKQRKVTRLTGMAEFVADHRLQVTTAEGLKTVQFEQCIIAVGSRPIKLAHLPWSDDRLMDSTDALALRDVPERLLIVGGGIIGLEMATVYHALGSKVTVMELTDQLIPGCDRDLVKPLQQRIAKQYAGIWLNTKLENIVTKPESLEVSLSRDGALEKHDFDKVLIAIGRQPNGAQLAAEKAGVTVTERGFIPVDRQMRTNVAHIFAIGDVVGQPMLAHKAVHEAKVAAENAAGHRAFMDARVIPSVAYTDPEVAWFGVTETEAKAQGLAFEKGVFPWLASGRALSMGREEGVTKLLFDRDSRRVIGGGIVGLSAGELLAEAVLACEMGADVDDLSLLIHAHPTLSETIGFAAEMATGEITDLYAPRRQAWPVNRG